MRGVGEASAAITLVNALPTGIGSAVGIGLWARATVELTPGTSRASPGTVFTPPSTDTPLVHRALERALDAFADGHAATHLAIDSQIPVATGLKSSSAVASAVVRAVARARGVPVPPDQVARLSASIGRETGVSATGAFDDALAGVSSEVVVTDNRSDRLLLRFPVDPSLGVVVWVPPGTHPPSPGVRDRFLERAGDAQAAVDLARAERPWEAMERNSELVEASMGYDYLAVRRRARELGAVGVGVSGLGPALALVAPSELTRSVVEVVAGLPGTVHQLAFTHLPARPEGP